MAGTAERLDLSWSTFAAFVLFWPSCPKSEGWDEARVAERRVERNCWISRGITKALALVSETNIPSVATA
jgi:hypothetical protein